MGLADTVYNLLLAMLSVFYLPFLALRRKDIKAYFRGFSPDALAKLEGRKRIWFQAVSVGEVSAVLPLIKAWREEHPDWAVILTTTTEGGQATAQKIAASSVDLIGYFPLDIPWVVRRVLRQVRPSVFIMGELEIWPNFLRLAHAMGTWNGIVNGRISDRSFPKYRLIRPLLRAVWRRVDRVCAQSEPDAQRFRDLGAPPERISVTGNIKFDNVYPEIGADEVERFKKLWQWDRGQLILTAASTHPGEEMELIETYQGLREKFNCRLLLAPRHPDRREEIVKQMKETGLTFALRSKDTGADDPALLLMDTFGELALAYTVGDAVFVGGSLVSIGGHNILEAAAQRRPPVFGPYMHNFLEIEAIFRREGAGIAVKDRGELQDKIAWLWENPAQAKQLGQKAWELVLKHRGATRSTLSLLPGKEIPE